MIRNDAGLRFSDRWMLRAAFAAGSGLALYLFWITSEYLAFLFDIPDGAPVRDQPNGWVWMLCSMVVFALMVLRVNFLFLRGIAELIAHREGWTTEQTRTAFWRSEYPEGYRAQGSD